MDALITALMPLYERERAAGRPMVLAVVVRTTGSTYSKHGTPLLIAGSGDFAGLLSGGCFEGDLREHSRSVFEQGVARLVSYDMRGPDDELFGLGAGCEGAMDIFLMRVGPENGWQPLAAFQAALTARRRTAAALVVTAAGTTGAAGAVVLGEDDSPWAAELATVARDGTPGWLTGAAGARVFALPLVLPPQILVLGAGPDAVPLVDFATRLGWSVIVHDHRPAYADGARFPAAARVVLARPEALAGTIDLGSVDAAVVMSHHLESDAAYLRALAASRVPYVGLLGPAPRRERLRAAIGPELAVLDGRLRSPVGLNLGGRASTSIALAIVAEIHAFVHRRPQVSS